MNSYAKQRLSSLGLVDGISSDDGTKKNHKNKHMLKHG